MFISRLLLVNELVYNCKSWKRTKVGFKYEFFFRQKENMTKSDRNILLIFKLFVQYLNLNSKKNKTLIFLYKNIYFSSLKFLFF